jgi:hypothetical protein
VKGQKGYFSGGSGKKSAPQAKAGIHAKTTGNVWKNTALRVMG